MKKYKISIIIISIFLIFTVCAQSVYGETSRVVRAAQVDNTYDWEAGIYGMESEKKQYVTIQGVPNKTVDYNEISYGSTEIEPSVGYAYYVAKTAGLDDRDMQSVIYLSDRWGNTSNVKIMGTSQEIHGEGTIYQRASQYGNVYYGILFDAIKNNKKILRIKEENTVKENVKVLADQENGTYTVGPYKLELNVESNSYTTEGAKILLKELRKDGNSGYSEENAFAKYNGITGINGTEAIFVDVNGQQIAFPDFTPGAEKDFYIRFKPNNDGAIDSTGNPIVNVSYLTKFVAKNLVKGVPKTVKFGEIKETNTGKAEEKTETIKEEKLNKKNYGAVQSIQLSGSESSVAAQLEESLGLSEIIVETNAMKMLGTIDAELIETRPTPKVQANGVVAWDKMHYKDIIRIDPDGTVIWAYAQPKSSELGGYPTVIMKNGKEVESLVVKRDYMIMHEDLVALAYEGEVKVKGSVITRNQGAYVAEVMKAGADSKKSVTLLFDSANKDVMSCMPKSISYEQAKIVNRSFG